VKTILHFLCRPRKNKTRVESFARDEHASLYHQGKVTAVKNVLLHRLSFILSICHKNVKNTFHFFVGQDRLKQMLETFTADKHISSFCQVKLMAAKCFIV